MLFGELGDGDMSFKLYDLTKKGTLILSEYRCGTHFLEVVITDLLECKENIRSIHHNEIDSFVQFQFMKQQKGPAYQTAIINSNQTKWQLIGNQEILADWHVVRLTRNDLVNHWISFYIWVYQNTDEFKMPHHGGTKETYQNIVPCEFNVERIYQWLTEKLVSNLFHNDEIIDYADLASLSDGNIPWVPNQYNLSLNDLFTNHEEIYNLLVNVSRLKN